MAGAFPVAPRVGAWIETARDLDGLISKGRSRPAWARGLKRKPRRRMPRPPKVAPRVGAWIETARLQRLPGRRRRSRPAWARGLKHALSPRMAGLERSRPAWARGLKPHRAGGNIHGIRVAPRVGAWIETCLRCTIRPPRPVAPRVGAWIETAKAAIGKADLAMVAPRVGAWIETRRRRRT